MLWLAPCSDTPHLPQLLPQQSIPRRFNRRCRAGCLIGGLFVSPFTFHHYFVLRLSHVDLKHTSLTLNACCR
jgi:hypothetical protein